MGTIATLVWLDTLPTRFKLAGGEVSYLLARASGGGLWVQLASGGPPASFPATLRPVRVEQFAVAAEASAARPGPPRVARSSRMECEPDHLEQATPAFSDRLMPELLQVPGFVAAHLLLDRASGTRFTLSVWESREALDGSERLVAPQRAQIGEDIRVQRPVEVELFDVVWAA